MQELPAVKPFRFIGRNHRISACLQTANSKASKRAPSLLIIFTKEFFTNETL